MKLFDTGPPAMTFPVVSIDSIPSHGLSVTVGPWAEPSVAEALGGPVLACTGGLTLLRKGLHIIVQGDLSARAEVACDRCGEAITLPVAGPVSCVYSPATALPEPEEDDDRHGPAFPSGLPVAVTDVSEYTGDSLDLRDVVAEFFAVERPMRVVCGEVDPSLEAECSARWNLRAPPDSEPLEPAPSPFSILKQFKPKP